MLYKYNEFDIMRKKYITKVAWRFSKNRSNYKFAIQQILFCFIVDNKGQRYA